MVCYLPHEMGSDRHCPTVPALGVGTVGHGGYFLEIHEDMLSQAVSCSGTLFGALVVLARVVLRWALVALSIAFLIRGTVDFGMSVSSAMSRTDSPSATRASTRAF